MAEIPKIEQLTQIYDDGAITIIHSSAEPQWRIMTDEEQAQTVEKVGLDLETIEVTPNCIVFRCSGNCLKTLPILPTTLQLLECIDNQLTELPTLPEGLTFLKCSYNYLKTLPNLPVGLRGIEVENNPLEENYPELFDMISKIDNNRMWSTPTPLLNIVEYVNSRNAELLFI